LTAVDSSNIFALYYDELFSQQKSADKNSLYIFY